MSFNQTHIDRLNQTTALVEANPAHWDQGIWHCGTSHCWAGFGDIIANQWNIDRHFEQASHLDTVNAEWYGLTNHAWVTITHIHNSLDDIKLLVAAAIKGQGSIDFSGADLMGVALRNLRLSNANLTKACLAGANLTYTSLTYANLTYANLVYANLTGVDLTGANLTGANLTRADLYCANLTDANLTGADLTGADLCCADLTGADLNSANLTSAKLTGAIYKVSRNA